ncbi:MAG: ABC transporter ATP-binding protein [Eubacterium sp.]|nr:ABC transporter ATP-binding protein [Eubacterium sp.]
MKQLSGYLKPYRKESFAAPLFKLLEALMDLLVPLVVAAVINRGIGLADTAFVIRCVLFLILLAALGMGFSFTAQWMAARASVGFSADLRQSLFDHIQTLSYAQFDSIGTDTLITRMTSDINQVQNGVNLSLRLLLRSPFIVFGAMIMAFTIDVDCAMIFVAVIVALSLVVFGIMAASIPLYAKAQEALDRLLTVTRENLTGVRVIRAFGREEAETEEFDRRNRALTGMNEQVGRLSALMNPATYVLINLATVVLIRRGALTVSLGGLTQGEVVALYNYMAQIVVELIKLASLIITINRSLACASRIGGILEIRPDMEWTGQGQTFGLEENVPAVVFDHVTFRYEGSAEPAVEDIDFCVGKGETVGIIGATGSGKSTVANLIARFYDVTEGAVRVGGRDVRTWSRDDLLSLIGIVPQKTRLFAGTIRDNLKLGNEKASDEEVMKAVETAQALEVVQGREQGLDAMIEQNGRNLSGGQKQRLAIARALVKKPSILILDDSASALDMATDQRLRKAIAGLPGRLTVFIISQRTSSVRGADQILVMDDGRLVGAADHETLLETCPVYREIYESQYPGEEVSA